MTPSDKSYFWNTIDGRPPLTSPEAGWWYWVASLLEVFR